MFFGAIKKGLEKMVFVFLIALFLFSESSVLASTSAFTFNVDTSTYNVTDDVTLLETLHLGNMDGANWIILNMSERVNDKTGWIYFEEDYAGLSASQNRDLSFVLHVPAGVCEDTYKARLKAILIAYGPTGEGLSGVSFFSAVGIILNINVTSGITCVGDPIPGLDTPISEAKRIEIYALLGKDPNEPVPDRFPYGAKIVVADEGKVFHDVNGDGVFDTLSDDKDVPMGTARIYSFVDTLLQTTDLSLTSATYDIPTGTFSGPANFYLTVDTSKYDTGDPSILDKTWEGNLYVNRMGTASDLANAYVFSGLNSYNEMIDNIDLRSRNTDQAGDWSSGTISIGPDDKDQIISSVRWDYEVAGTDFKYADLDHSGRIGPDDKDHIISPLYWDFPN